MYLVAESFGSDTNKVQASELMPCLSKFVSDLNKMLILAPKEENLLYFDNRIYNLRFQDSKFTLIDIVSKMDGDDGRAFWDAVQRADFKDWSIGNELAEINKVLSGKTEKEWNVPIMFVEHKGIVCYCKIFYMPQDWVMVRRSILASYPGNGEQFMQEAEKYFDNLCFSPNCKEDIKPILAKFSERIVFHLAALNDKFLSIEEGNNETETLKKFSVVAKLDETASLEGKGKERLVWDFVSLNGENMQVKCEPHMKLCKNDKNDGEYFYNRIYFHRPIPKIAGSKILVGYIGKHP